MADVDVNLDSSDLPLILEALGCLKAALEDKEESNRGEHPKIVQIDLLINTFQSAEP